MTQLDHPTEFDAKAAESGANATRVFQSKESAARPEISKERVDEVATAAIKAVHEVIRDKQVTYEEYDALKAWMIQVGLDGEWPLFLDVWVEHVVEEVANADREGSKGTIEGPYYVPDAPELPAECTLEMRDDEAGTPLLFQGQVRGSTARRSPGQSSTSGTPTTPGSTRSSHQACRTGCSGRGSRPTTRAATSSTRCSPRRTRSRPTARAASSSLPPGGTPGAPRTST